MLYFLAYSGLISGVFALVFGLFVYLKNKRSVVNQSYGVLSLALVFWGIPYFFWPLANTKEQALLSFQLLHVGAILVGPAYLWFIFALLNIHKQFKKLIIAAYVIAGTLLVFIPTSLFIRDMVPQYIFRYWAVPGIMYHVFLLFWFCGVFFVWLHLGIQYHRAVGSRKNQLKYVLIGTVLGILGGATNYLPWYKIYIIPPVGTILVAVHVVIFAYAIVKYRLMDINVTITRAGIFLAVFTLVLWLPFLLATSGKPWLIKSFGVYWWLGPMILLAGLGTSGPFVYMFLKEKADAILLREQRRYQAILKNAAVDLTRIRNLQKLLDFIAKTITESVRITHSAIYFFDPKNNVFLLKAGVNIPDNQRPVLEAKNALITRLQNLKEAMVFDEMMRISGENPASADAQFAKQMKGLHAAVIVPCFLEDKLVGIISLGEKLSEKLYSQSDIDNFAVLAKEVALATENAQLYEKIENEVKERTQELVQTQKQLVQAEKLATMGTLAGGVAHEINNPLTAILTNAQILLETGRYDKESLEMIEEATKRCRTIVQKLMAYAKKPVEATMVYDIDLKEVITNAVSFLKFQLEQDNITVHINTSDSEYMVKGNHNELEQVVTNLILNGKDAIRKIKKSGSIDLALSQDKTWVMLAVQDEGAGIPPQIMGRIFDPFFTTKDVGKGLGLGLSICQSIIDKHKGKILVDSEVNKGTTFTMYLPRVKVS